MSKLTPREAMYEEINKPNFNPWKMIGSVYGTYDSGFDEIAIAVLKDLLRGTREETSLAGLMFREMLCVKGWCDYGSGPNACWWILGGDLLKNLIIVWEEHRKREWE